MRSGVVRGVFVGRRLLFGGGVVKDGVVNAAPRVSLLRPHCSVQATVESARLLVPRLLEPLRALLRFPATFGARGSPMANKNADRGPPLCLLSCAPLLEN